MGVTAAPFSFSDLRMMFIELRGASTIDCPGPIPPSSPNSQYKTPPPQAFHEENLTSFFTSGGGGATVEISHASHWGPVVKQIVCRRSQLFGFDYPFAPARSPLTVNLPPYTNTTRTSDCGDKETTV